ncbi:alpha/beta-hydrolase [Auriscalpium vulgare]|uniref:Alpha/beta-hydrolase n=1 Tax=Auriscalpium vulgare TaxID=40419 RepID=A0ACB8RFM2_9AGAM|nr:alpha/beta-hydrolase [Auriscalpium vulgare]
MPSNRHSPYGNWASPISAEAVAAQSLSAGVEDVFLDAVTSKIFFAQIRPAEDGRSAIVDASSGKDLLDQSWDARTLVHEYGGAAAVVHADVLYFSHVKDGRVYRWEKGSAPVPVTPASSVLRYADFNVHPGASHLLVCIVEDHSDPHPARVVTTLGVINASASTVTTLVQGADFYACPRFSPDGKFLVWQQWHHPELPWQSAEILLAPCDVSPGDSALQLGSVIHVAGKHEVVSAQDPGWSSNNSLFFFSDVSGYHNPWKFTFDSAAPSTTGKAEPILAEPVEEEFGAPQWWLSRHGSGALSATKLALLAFRQARSTLYVCDLEKGSLLEVPTPFAHIQYMHGDLRGRVVMLGQPADSGEVLSELVLDERGSPVVRPVSPHTDAGTSSLLPSSSVSVGQSFVLKLDPDDRVCHTTYYPPKNPDYDGGVPGEKPPVVVLIHGGPFYMEPAALDWSKQFFTSRGWAYLDVNYGGSSGFGRKYRESLHGKWGILDIDDAYGSILKLEELGLLDSKRAVVHGGSAGGYSVLQIATTLPAAFAAGAPHYGISDMRKLDEVLHKFEYYLCDRLMGGRYEECRDVWHARSPIYHVDKIKMPLLVLQGEKDTVVPAEQMINMVKIIKDAGGKAELVLFPDEGHGWRQAKSVQIALEKQLAFFNDVLGFENNA